MMTAKRRMIRLSAAAAVAAALPLILQTTSLLLSTLSFSDAFSSSSSKSSVGRRMRSGSRRIEIEKIDGINPYSWMSIPSSPIRQRRRWKGYTSYSSSSSWSSPSSASVLRASPTSTTTTILPPPRLVKRVAVIGGGIAGLSLAHALRSKNMMLDVVKDAKERRLPQQQNQSSSSSTPFSSPSLPSISIDIFESRSSFSSSSKSSGSTGSGIQLTGGMAALHRINPQLQQLVSAAALPLGGVVSYCRPWFEFPGGGADDEKDKKGWKILELNVQRAILEEQQQLLQKKELEKKVENEGLIGGDRGKQDTKYGLVTSTGEILAYTILRSTLQHVLRSTLQRDHDIAVQFDKRLIGISYSDEVEERGLCSNGIHCHFADGSSSGPYDLVVGCDGIGSAVREYVNTGNIDSSLTSSTKKVSSSSAIYSGLRITFAIQGGEGEEVNIEEGNGMGDENVARPTSCQFNQFFGNGAYALTSTYGAGKGRPPAKGAFLVYPDPNYIGPFPRRKEESALTTTKTNSAASVTSSIDPNTIDNNDTNADTSNSKQPQPDENPDWSQDKRITKERILECLQILQDASVPGKDASNTIEQSTRFFDLGVYLHNPFSWNGWIREVLRGSGGGNDWKERRRRTGAFAVTAGDASHAMPPFLGQGANQALQDSCALAAKIFEYNYEVEYPSSTSAATGEITPHTQPDLKTYLKEYERVRWMPTTSLTVKAAILGYLEVGPWLLGNVRDAFFFVMGKAGVAKKIFLDAATPKM